MDPDVVLRIQDLSKTYGGAQALTGLTCEVRRGEVVGLLGPNGAGKTTTFKLLLGMLRPTGGRCEVLGFDCTRQAIEVKKRLGYTPDEPAFYGFLTGAETIDFVARMRGVSSEQVDERLRPVIEQLDFGAQLEVLTSGYSHGMKKKLAVMLALVHAPPVMLLDEPTNGLDPPTAAKVRELLREQAAKGVAVVVSTHLLDMADRLCSRVLVLNRGRLLTQGTTGQVRATAGVAPEASLEEAFLRLMT